MPSEIRVHPLMIFRWIKPFLFFLILPAAQGTVRFVLYGRAFVPLWEIFAAAALFFMAGVRLLFCRIGWENTRLALKSGVLFRKTTLIPPENVVYLRRVRTPLDWLFGSQTVTLGTRGGGRFVFKLYSRDGERLKRRLFGDTPQREIRISALRAAAVSATRSSAVAGVLLAALLLRRAGKLAGTEADMEVLSRIGRTADRLAGVFPPILNLLLMVLLLGFSVSFLSLFLGNLRAALFVGEKTLEEQAGLFIRRQVVFRREAVTAVRLRRTLLARLFSRDFFQLRMAGGGRKESGLLFLSPDTGGALAKIFGKEE